MKLFMILSSVFMITFFLQAEEMTYEEIARSYKKSYDYETIGKYEKAINSLKNVFLNYDTTYTVNYRLGWLYYLDQKYANALEHLDKALLIYPSSIEVLNTLILVHAVQLDWNKVEGKSIQVIKIDYYNFTANYWYSYALRMQGKYDNAVAVDRKMLIVFPTSTVFLLELAENLFANGAFTESKQIFDSVLILDPDNSTAEMYLKKFE